MTSVADGTSPSFVAGTQSSPSIASPRRRDRKRSTPPRDRAPSHALSPRPRKDGNRQTVVPPFVVKQYLAIESATSWQDGSNVAGVFGESAEREAGYLLDDGSLLARDQVRDCLGEDMPWREGDEGAVEWRSVPLRIPTMEDLWINGRSWIYQLPPPTIRSDDPTMIITPGAIVGKVTADLVEWERDPVVPAFSPTSPRLSGTANAPATALRSPFTSQPNRKRKPTSTHRSRPVRSPSSTRTSEASPYVFVNDLPPWEWEETGSECGTTQPREETQSARESLRHSWDDGRSRKKVKPAVNGPSAVERHRRASLDLGSASFLTEASIVEDEHDEPRAPSHLSGQPGDDGRIMHRMPMMLKGLDHIKLQRTGNEHNRGVKVEPREMKRRDGVNNRVRDLQLATEKDVRPIKDFLPLAMRMGGAAEPTKGLGGPGEMDDSVVEDISFAEFTHVEPAIGHSDHVRIPDPTDEASRILLEGTEVVIDSPRGADPKPVAALSRRQLARRRIIEDKERYGALYDIIAEPHVVVVPLQIPEQPAPPPFDYLCEPIPIYPTGHPFHPSLQYYIDKSPHTRVKWLIPIHGPVDLVDSPGIEAFAAFRPSPAHLALTEAEYRDTRRRYRQSSSVTGYHLTPLRPILWTRDALAETWDLLVKMRKLGRLGPITLTLASSEPDPFRPARQSTDPIHQHKCVPFRCRDTARRDSAPTRPEIGDHIKLFCDLRFALAVRHALRYLALGSESNPPSRKTSVDPLLEVAPMTGAPSLPVHPRQALGPSLSTATFTSSKVSGGTHLPFRGAKLCLVGDRGEVLAVV